MTRSVRSTRSTIRLAGLVALVAVTALAAPGCTSDQAVWPTTGIVTSLYGTRCPGSDVHRGIDIASIGRVLDVDVVAVQAGTITFAGWQRGYGRTLIVTHGNGWSSLYAHLNSFVRSSGRVQQGEHIGEMGATGNATGIHLHFEMRRNGVPQNFNRATTCGASVRVRTRMNVPFPGIGSAPTATAMSAAVVGDAAVTDEVGSDADLSSRD